ncbi:hypothetical protein M427DRAFT_171625 [Gonapodya prolifera JEL478]|uniref:Uncharacterized protein n=1 Tax=Gonapodya prolifera (strain JEL478) TaxID=1344416 RepID=A0A139B065_GONPJ|nr:hypothetical protein M427DRAFT_171625 [Gonapodya prolifera JEL478]|eukprot:KXS22392.1 hypothetical protein M427DRAFT_171625 [Gonapodya prolifera JEL478]
MGFVGDTGRNLISMVSESDGENTKGESNKEGNGDGFDGERARNWDAGEGSSRQPEMSVSSRQSTAEDDQKENTEADRSARNGSRSAERDERREQRAKQKRQLRAYTALRSAPPIPPSLVEVPASGTALLCRPQGGTWPTWPVISESVDSESLTEEQRKSFEEACAEQQEDTQEPIEVEDILVPLWFFSEHLDFTL